VLRESHADKEKFVRTSMLRLQQQQMALRAKLDRVYEDRRFGAKGDVDPVRYLLGAASAWANPDKDAIYLNVVPKTNDGKTVHCLTLKDVPVDAFWSVSVYNAQGYFERNGLNAYALNSLTAAKSSTVQ
jgi:hypothetical protein